jgi:hypothetical protein
MATYTATDMLKAQEEVRRLRSILVEISNSAGSMLYYSQGENPITENIEIKERLKSIRETINKAID